MRILTLLFAFSFFAACSVTPENNTHYAFKYVENDILKPGSTVIIASANLGVPSRKYLEKYEPRIDSLLRGYLEANGYKVISSRLFEDPYKNAINTYGSPYDQFTGKQNNKQLMNVLASTFESLKQKTDADAVIFTDLLERQVMVARSSSKRFVKYDGVYRLVKSQGTSQSVSTEFNWGEPLNGASLSINIFTLSDGKRVFNNIGGLDVTEAIDTRKDTFARYKNMFKEEDHLMEGVKLSMHPVMNRAYTLKTKCINTKKAAKAAFFYA